MWLIIELTVEPSHYTLFFNWTILILKLLWPQPSGTPPFFAGPCKPIISGGKIITSILCLGLRARNFNPCGPPTRPQTGSPPLKNTPLFLRPPNWARGLVLSIAELDDFQHKWALLKKDLIVLGALTRPYWGDRPYYYPPTKLYSPHLKISLLFFTIYRIITPWGYFVSPHVAPDIK